MIYKINDKYYVKIGYEYNEIELKLDENDDVVLVPLKNRIEETGVIAKQINFLAEKEKLKEELLNKNNNKDYTKPKKNQWR